ncbi:MAG: Asp-tRNA(Asn)/Glu-tRNA(Gln) amidotransferase GatCAB subunit B, partial [Schleiferilactobacillus harbinensis]
PEPDIPPFHISQEWIDEIGSEIPEMPNKRRERYVNDYGLPEYDAGVLTATKEMSDFFDATVKAGAPAKQAANWLMGNVNAYLNEQQVDLSATKLTPDHLAGMIKLVSEGTISSKIAKKVFQEIITSDTDPRAWVEQKGLIQQSDPAVLTPIIDSILDNNGQSIEDFKNGKDRAVGFLVGQIMKQTHGKANPQVVNQILMAELKKR